MRRAKAIRFTEVQDRDLGHVTIEIATPFKWIGRDFPDDSLRVRITEDTLGDLLETIAANLESCPRARLLVEMLDGDSRIEWVEFFDGGLEVFIDADRSDTVEQVSDDLWKFIQHVARETKYTSTLERVNRLGLFPRSLKACGLSGKI